MSKSTSKAAVAATAVALGLAACGGGTAADDEVVISLGERSASGQSGTARLTAAGESRTRVVIRLRPPAAVSQPAHVHGGTCADFDPLPIYTLTSVEDGSSETVVPLSFEKLLSSKVVVNVHKSDQELRISVACGEVD